MILFSQFYTITIGFYTITKGLQGNDDLKGAPYINSKTHKVPRQLEEG